MTTFFITDLLLAQNIILLHPVDVLKGADGRNIYSPEISDLFIPNIHECLRDGQLREIEYSLDVENEDRHYFQARIAPFEENGWLKFYVTDTDCGIPDDKLPKIFARFEKLNDFVQGTGLGLSICQNIVERLGERIEVNSKMGEGSTFAFYLPYYLINEQNGEVISTCGGMQRNTFKTIYNGAVKECGGEVYLIPLENLNRV